jgi:hypothetical protein
MTRDELHAELIDAADSLEDRVSEGEVRRTLLRLVGRLNAEGLE